MLDPRAIAVEGIGSSPRLVALRGLWPDEEPPPTHVHTDVQVSDEHAFLCSVTDDWQ